MECISHVFSQIQNNKLPYTHPQCIFHPLSFTIASTVSAMYWFLEFPFTQLIYLFATNSFLLPPSLKEYPWKMKAVLPEIQECDHPPLHPVSRDWYEGYKSPTLSLLLITCHRIRLRVNSLETPLCLLSLASSLLFRFLLKELLYISLAKQSLSQAPCPEKHV